MATERVTVIETPSPSVWGRLKAAWEFRRYYRVLLKDITLRQVRNTILGYWWLIIRPIVPIAILIVTFHYFVGIETGTLPYPLFLLAGYVVWILFASTITFMARSLMWTRSLMRKMYLPKMIVPAASIGPPLIQAAIVAVAFIIVAIAYYVADGVPDITLAWRMLVVIPCLALALLLAMTIGSIIAIIALLARDIIFSIGWIVQFAMFVTPVVYPVASAPPEVQWAFYVFNPMTGVVETARWALTGFGAFEPLWFAVTVVEIGLIAFLCLTFFARAETYLSDVI